MSPPAGSQTAATDVCCSLGIHRCVAIVLLKERENVVERVKFFTVEPICNIMRYSLIAAETTRALQTAVLRL